MIWGVLKFTLIIVYANVGFSVFIIYVCWRCHEWKAFFLGKGKPIRPFLEPGTRHDAQSNSIPTFIQLNPSVRCRSLKSGSLRSLYVHRIVDRVAICTASKTNSVSRRRLNYPTPIVFFIAKIHIYNKTTPRGSSEEEALIRTTAITSEIKTTQLSTILLLRKSLSICHSPLYIVSWLYLCPPHSSRASQTALSQIHPQSSPHTYVNHTRCSTHALYASTPGK